MSPEFAAVKLVAEYAGWSVVLPPGHLQEYLVTHLSTGRMWFLGDTPVGVKRLMSLVMEANARAAA